jgi:putative ABC transport system permease protein
VAHAEPGGRAPLRLLIFLARKGLGESRVITALMVLAVVAGVAFQIPNTANLDGYTAELYDHAVNHGYGQLRLFPARSPRLEVTDALRARVAADADVVAVVPLVVLAGAAGRNGTFRQVAVVGVDLAEPRKPFLLADGEPLRDDRDAVVGTSVASRLGITPGGQVELRVILGTGTGDRQLDDGLGKYTMRVRGLATGTFVAPEAVFVDRGLLAQELGERAPASFLAVYTRPGADVDEVAGRLASALPELTPRTWAQDSVFAASAIRSSAVLASLSRAMVALAVIVPIWALLYIHVLHHQRDIALMGALGLTRMELFAVYVAQALLVGVVGVLLGGALGYGAIRWFEAHPIFHMDVFVVRPARSAGAFAWPMLLVLAFTLAASVIPAWRAARTEPAPILRSQAT